MSKTLLCGMAALAAVLSGGASQAQTPIPPSPKDFVAGAVQSDQYEIMAAQIAVVQGQDPRVRAFAEAMIRDHARLAEAMRQAALAGGVPPPGSGLSSDQALLLGSLQSVRGTAFDKTYAAQQELVHAQAEAVDDSFATAGGEANLKKAAQAALPIIQDHLKAATQLRVELGGR